ncbi:hypothetical protein BOX15_Mlig000963g3 [Macrostomum lignano]|uniref:Innexin n=1 Tax=Macrostomum lignano TaxID=282301 RepID=A0A267F988_9PLAT|nr:hypothetical protein BOX15_Mlig033254g1 [Macrostomum lignano]PAA78853.1 hypothetical protein BOX15_Mlig000963g3 [Macrostomum lignano]
MSTLVNFIKGIKESTKPGAEDACDRMHFIWTPMLLLLCSLVVFGKEYIGNPMHCVFSGNPQHHPSGFLDFAQSYCWAYGTYAYSKDAAIRLTGYRKDVEKQEEYWTETISNQLLTYYQWVPYALLAQCVITYLPKLIWQLICSRKFGSDIYSLISLAAEARTSSANEFRQQADRIADVIERLLMYNREYRHGRLQQLKATLYNRCSLLVPSKRTGTMLTILYVLVKLLCLANVVGQLFFMAVFLGFWRRGIFTFGWTIVQNLNHGRGWKHTMLFPLHTLCYLTTSIDPGTTNAYVGQCTLPVNIINEKVYILLFFWFVSLGVVTVLSIARWTCRLLFTRSRVSFVKCLLYLSALDSSDAESRLVDKLSIKSFIEKFLRHDGVFLVLMLSEGSDKVITAEVLRRLYQRWCCNNKRPDLRGSSWMPHDHSLHGNDNGGATAKIRNRSLGTSPKLSTESDSQMPSASTVVDESGLLTA